MLETYRSHAEADADRTHLVRLHTGLNAAHNTLRITHLFRPEGWRANHHALPTTGAWRRMAEAASVTTPLLRGPFSARVIASPTNLFCRPVASK